MVRTSFSGSQRKLRWCCFPQHPLAGDRPSHLWPPLPPLDQLVEAGSSMVAKTIEALLPNRISPVWITVSTVNFSQITELREGRSITGVCGVSGCLIFSISCVNRTSRSRRVPYFNFYSLHVAAIELPFPSPPMAFSDNIDYSDFVHGNLKEKSQVSNKELFIEEAIHSC